MSIDKRSDGHLYAAHARHRSLKKMLPAHNKAFFELSFLAAIANPRWPLAWVKQHPRLAKRQQKMTTPSFSTASRS
jgi:hypothetical protein